MEVKRELYKKRILEDLKQVKMLAQDKSSWRQSTRNLPYGQNTWQNTAETEINKVID